MTISIKTPQALAEIGEPAPLLTYLGGELAPRIAAIWPAPHAEFLTAPAERRHLAGLALAAAPYLAPRDFADLLSLPLKEAIRLVLPEPPAGLARALTRLGERCWAGEDYRQLARWLAHPQAGKALRHADCIEPMTVRLLAALPEEFAAGRAAGLPLSADAAALIKEAAVVIVERDGEAGRAKVEAWRDSVSLSELFRQLRDDLEPELPAPPLAGSARLRPLASKAKMLDAAKRYRNCLAGELPYAHSGRSAFFEWHGQPPAIVELGRDRLFGWTFEQARIARNKPVPEAEREAILSALRQMGVHLGRDAWAFREAARNAHRPTFKLTSAEQLNARRFGDD